MRVNSMLPINKPLLGTEEREAVLKVLDGGVLTNPSSEGGPNINEFERGLAAFVKAKHAIAVNSGTAALHASLLALKIGPGDEVIVPSFTFAATASAVMLTGAKPVFVDIDISSYNMSSEAFRKAVTARTKAVIPVDLFGLPADMDAISEIAEDTGVHILEDSCQAQGASYKGKMAGTLGELGCFSFYPGKVMTTGEGGAVITNDDDLAERIRRIRTHGQIKGYDSVILGGNFRMPEIEASIGIVQLKKLPKFLEARAKNAALLKKKLSDSSLVLPDVPAGYCHNWYLFTIMLHNSEERDLVKQSLKEAGIGAAVYYPTPVHRIPLYSGLGYGGLKLPETEKAAESVLSIPVNPLVTEDDLERMSVIIKSKIH
jgi:dTDP-4-amino-4,6-dideoxygalactose transaminase